MLAVISNCYPPVWGRLPTRYSPVRHSVNYLLFRRFVRNCFVRLACVKHAASVHPEPGSNSHVWMFVSSQNLLWLLIPKKQRFVPFVFRRFLLFLRWSLVRASHPLEWKFIEFSGLFHCLIIKVRFSLFTSDFVILSHRFQLVKYFFSKLFKFFCISFSKPFKKLAASRQLDYSITLIFICQPFFEKITGFRRKNISKYFTIRSATP